MSSRRHSRESGNPPKASRLGNSVAVVVAMIALLAATLNVNVAANVVSPANDFSNLYPARISFKLGGLITCFVGFERNRGAP